MREQDEKVLNSKKSNTQKLKDLQKQNTKGKHINVNSGVRNAVLSQALKIKTQIEELEREQKALDARYQVLRDQLLQDIQAIETSDADSVEYVNNGMRAYKYPKNTKIGQIDEKSLKELAKKRKVYKKVFKKVEVVDEVGLLIALAEGRISVDEYVAVTLTKNVPVLEIKYVEEEIGGADADEEVI